MHLNLAISFFNAILHYITYHGIEQSLTSKVLGSNGESEGRSILGFCSGIGLEAAGEVGKLG